MATNLLAGGGTNADITNPAFGNSFLSDLLASTQSPTYFFNKFIPGLVGVAFVWGTIYFLFMVLLGAIQWISSSGDKQALETARAKITNALIGIVILFGSFAVVNVIEIFFGINILTIDIGPLVIQ